jgi:hypothetical protein
MLVLIYGKKLIMHLKRATWHSQYADLLSYKLDAFKMYLSRTSPKVLSDIQRQTHVDFAYLFTQIMSSIPGDAKRAERVEKRILENKQVAERKWLLEKARALKGR